MSHILLIIMSLLFIGSSAYNINRNPNLLASINREKYYVCNYNTRKCSPTSRYVKGAFSSSLECGYACVPQPRLIKGRG